MDTHTIEVGAAAVGAAVLSGFGGAYLGARMTTRHDRIERARARRIEAADDLVQAWPSALFVIEALIGQIKSARPETTPMRSYSVPEAYDLINTAVSLSTRLDLLLGAVSLASRNEDAVRDQARAAVAAILEGDLEEARRQHAAASLSLAWLVNTAGGAIASTGTKKDEARRFREVPNEPDADPSRRRG